MLNLNWAWDQIPHETEEQVYYARGAESIHNALSDTNLADLEFRPYTPSNPLPNRKDFRKNIEKTDNRMVVQFFSPDNQPAQRFDSDDLTAITGGDMKKAEIILNALSEAFMNDNYHPSVNLPEDVKQAHTNFSRTAYREHSASLVLPMDVIREVFGSDAVDENTKGLYTWGVPQAIFYDNNAGIDEYIPPHIQTAFEQSTKRSWASLSDKEKKIFVLMHEEGHRRTFDLLNKDYDESQTDYVVGREEADANAIAIRGMVSYWAGTSTPTQRNPIDPYFFKTNTSPWKAFKTERQTPYQQMQSWVQSRDTGRTESATNSLQNIYDDIRKMGTSSGWSNVSMSNRRGLLGGKEITGTYDNRPVSIRMVGGRLGINWGFGSDRMRGFVALPQAGSGQTNTDVARSLFSHQGDMMKWVRKVGWGKSDEMRAVHVPFFNTQNQQQRFGFSSIIPGNQRGASRMNFLRDNRMFGGAKSRIGLDAQGMLDTVSNWGGSNSQVMNQLGMQKQFFGNAEGYANIPKFGKRMSIINRIGEQGIATMNRQMLPTYQNQFQGSRSNVLLEARYLLGQQFAEGESEKIRGLGVATPVEFEVDTAKVGGLQVGQQYGRKTQRGTRAGGFRDLRRMGMNISSSADAYEILNVTDIGGGKSLVAMARHSSPTVEKSMVKPGHVERNAGLMTKLIREHDVLKGLSSNGRVHLQTRMVDDMLLQSRRAMEGFRAAFGEDVYNKKLSEFIQNNADNLKGKHIADAFAVHYFTQGVNVDGKKVGGFEWTRTRATLSEDRIANLLSYTTPDDPNAYTQSKDWNGRDVWIKKIQGLDGTMRSAIDPESMKKGKYGIDVVLNDMVNISPVVADMHALHGRGVARIKGASMQARELTDPSFANSLREMGKAGIGIRPETYIIQADIANRMGKEGEDYLVNELGKEVVDIRSLDYQAINNTLAERITDDMTEAEIAKLKLDIIGNMYFDKFLTVRENGASFFLAPANQLRESFVERKEGAGFVDNFAKKVVNVLEYAEALSSDQSDTTKAMYAQSVMDAITSQSDTATNRKAVTKGLGIYLPAFTGHAMPARGLKANEVVVWRSNLEKITGLSQDQIEKLMADDELSLAVTRYPETDPTAAVIGAKIVLADLMDEKDRAKIGLSGDKGQVLISEAIQQASGGDFDVDQTSIIASHMAGKDGNVYGAKMKVHSEDEIRDIRDRSFAGEYKSSQKKIADRLNAKLYLDKLADKALARGTLDEIQTGVNQAIQAKGQIGRAFNFGIRTVFSGINQMLGDDPYARKQRQMAGSLAQGIYHPSLDAELIEGMDELLNLPFGYMNVERHTISFGKGDAKREMSMMEANAHVMKTVMKTVAGYKDDDQRDLMAMNFAGTLMSANQFKASLDASSELNSAENLTQRELAEELKKGGLMTSERLKKMYSLMLGDEQAEKQGLYPFFNPSKDAIGDADKSLFGTTIAGSLIERTRENAMKYGFNFSGLVPDQMQKIGKFMGGVFAGVRSLIPDKNFRVMPFEGLRSTLGFSHGKVTDAILRDRYGGRNLPDGGMVNTNPLIEMAMAGLDHLNMGGGLHRIKGQLVNTNYASNALGVLDSDVREFVSGNYVSGSALGYEFGVSETPQQREMRLLGMRVMPKEIISGPFGAGNLPRGERALIENAMNVVRQGLGLNPKTLSATPESLMGDEIHSQLQKHLLGNVADIDHVQWRQINRGGRTVSVPELDPRARAEVRIVDKEAGISGSLDAIYNGTVLDFKSKKTFDALHQQTNMSHYMHQLSAYHMMSVEGAGEINGEKILQSGIVPLSQKKGLSADERLAESVVVVKNFIGALERARDTDNIKGFVDIFKNVYGGEYIQNSTIDMDGIINYVKKTNTRLNKGDDWNIGILPMFGQEAVDMGAVDVNLSKRMYEADKELLSQVERQTWDTTQTRRELLQIARRILNSPSDVMRKIQDFRANRNAANLMRGFASGSDDPPRKGRGIPLGEDGKIIVHPRERLRTTGGDFEVKTEGTVPEADVEEITPVSKSIAKETPDAKFKYQFMRPEQYGQFQRGMQNVFGRASINAPGIRAFETYLNPDRLLQMGFSPDEAYELQEKTPFELVQDERFISRARSPETNREQLRQIRAFASGVYDISTLTKYARSNIGKGLVGDAVAENILNAFTELPSVLQDQIMKTDPRKAALDSMYAGNEGGGKQLLDAANALEQFTDVTGKASERFAADVEFMSKNINDAGEVGAKAMEKFNAWSESFRKMEMALSGVITQQTTEGRIGQDQYEALRGLRGKSGKLLVNETAGGYQLDVDELRATRDMIRDNLSTANTAYEKTSARRSQKSWEEMVGISREGAGNTRHLSEAWTSAKFGETFADGAFAGETKSLGLAARVSGTSLVSAALNPYNMFAAQRMWNIFGRPAMDAMGDYQVNRSNQEFMAFQGGFATGDELTSGMFGKIQQRAALNQRRHLAMGRGANYAYGGLADVMTGGTMEGLSSIGGVVMPAVGAGMGLMALTKGASAINILSGGAGFAGLATPLGLAVGGLMLAGGTASALSTAGYDYDAFSRQDPWAVMGARLGAITNVGEYQHKERYAQTAQRYGNLLRSGGGENIDLSEFTAIEQSGIRFQGFEDVYGELGQKLFGEKYNEEIQGTYRIAQTIDPAFSMLSNNQMTQNIMEAQRRYGTEPLENILMAASKASGYSRPDGSISDPLSAYMANTQDSTMVVMDRLQSAINATGTANQYGLLLGQPAYTYQDFMGFANNQFRETAGNIYGQLGQAQFGNLGASQGDYLAVQARQAVAQGNWQMAQRYASAYSASAPMVGSGQQIMGLLGASDVSQSMYGYGSAYATERYMENPVIAQNIDAMLQSAMRSNRGRELAANYSAMVNDEGDLVFGVTPEDRDLYASLNRYPEEIRVSRVGENAHTVMGRYGEEWSPYTPRASSSLVGLIDSVLSSLANIGDSYSIAGDQLNGMIALDLQAMNQRNYEEYMTQFTEKSGQFQAMGGNTQALISRAIRQRGIRLSDTEGIADINFDIMNQLASASPEQLQKLVGTSMSEAPLSAIDQFNARWGSNIFNAQIDFTAPYAAENAMSAVSMLESVMGGMPIGASDGSRRYVQSFLTDKGLGSADLTRNRQAQQYAQNMQGYIQGFQQQGFSYIPDQMNYLSAQWSQSLGSQPFLADIMGMSGSALNARMYRTNRANISGVVNAQSEIYNRMSALGESPTIESMNTLMAELGTEQFRLQAGIMGRTTGMGETAFLDASRLTNNDLMTQSIQNNAQRLFEAFSDVLIENASLSRQSQDTLAEMVIGGGLDYNDEYAVQGRMRGLGRVTSAMGMLDRYMMTGASSDQLMGMATQTFGMSSQQFAQWQGMESQNPYVMSQNLGQAQARWGSQGVPIAPINLQTGMATTITQLAPGGNMGFIDRLRGVNQQYKGAFLADYMTDDWLANIGGTAGIQGEIMNLQMSTQGASAGHGRRMLNLRNLLNRGNGTLDDQGFVVGGGLQPFQQAMAQQGFNINIGNGMSMWQIQDRRDQMQREMQMWDMDRQGRDKELQKRQFYEKWDFGYRQWDYNTQFQREEMQIGRQQQLTRRQWTQEDMAFSRNQQVTNFVWQREDMAFGRARNALEFGWQTEDFERNKRYARGRDRINLLREQERANIRYNMDVGQADKQEDRQAQQERWADEQFTKQMDRFNRQVQWEDQRFERQIEHFNIINAFELEQMLMEKRHFEERMALADEDFEKKKAHTLEMMQLEDQERLMSRQTSEAFSEIDQRFSEAMAGVQKKIAELSNLLQGISTTDAWIDGFMKLNQAILDGSAIVSPMATGMTPEAIEWMGSQGTPGKKVSVADQLGEFNSGFAGLSDTVKQAKGEIDPLNSAFGKMAGSARQATGHFEGVVRMLEITGAVSQNVRGSLSGMNAQIDHANKIFDSMAGALSRLSGSATPDGIDAVTGSLRNMSNNLPTLNQAINTTNNAFERMGSTVKNLAHAVNQSINEMQKSAGNLPGKAHGGMVDPLPMFAKGGYTGDGHKFQVAGVVHAGEYVIPQQGLPVIRESGGSIMGQMLEVLKDILHEQREIRKMGPGRVNIQAISNHPDIAKQIIRDEDRVKTMR